MGRGFAFRVAGKWLGGLFLLVVHIVLLALAGLAIFLLIALAGALLVALAGALLVALALFFLVSIALSGVLRVRLLSSLFGILGIHRSPFSVSINSDWGARRVTQSVLVNQVCFAQQQVSFLRRNRPNWTGLTIGFDPRRANPAFQVEMRGSCCIVASIHFPRASSS
jgi:hypothetical protein